MITTAFTTPFNGNTTWLAMLEQVFEQGERSAPRGKPILECLATTAQVDMTAPVVVNPLRKLGYRFMAAEAWWIASGRSDVASIAPYGKHIADFSDDGVTFFGAYGPKAKPQMSYVVEKLLEDRDSRQAVINIWRECPPRTKDVPCTTTVQWMIRGGKLHCIDTMRSNDMWLGFPYDIFNFSMLSACLALRLREVGVKVDLGQLYLRAGSCHLYEPNWAAAKACVEAHDQIKFDYAPLDLSEFENEAALLTHLKRLADRDWVNLQHKWLGELAAAHAAQN